MNVTNHLTQLADLNFDSRSSRFCSKGLALLFTLVFGVDQADAQIFRGFRPRGAIVVAPPILPSPYYGSPWGPPPIIAPPSSVRVRTPFFSLNLGSDGWAAPVYPSYNYRYESYRPSYGPPPSYDRYSPPTPGALVPGERTAPSVYGSRAYGSRAYGSGLSGTPNSYSRYQAGPNGGIPALTSPTRSFSLPALRSAAETLRGTLSRRPNDGQIWLDYLQPDTIIADVVEGKPSPAMKALLSRYVGVTKNPDLVSVTRLNGFGRTLDLLSAWLELEKNAAGAPQSDPVAADTGDRGETGVEARSETAADPVDKPTPAAETPNRAADTIEQLPAPEKSELNPFQPGS